MTTRPAVCAVLVLLAVLPVTDAARVSLKRHDHVAAAHTLSRADRVATPIVGALLGMSDAEGKKHVQQLVAVAKGADPYKMWGNTNNGPTPGPATVSGWARLEMPPWNMVPTEIADLCGGFPGHTKWAEVSRECGMYTTEMLRCLQVCNNANHYTGFGACMEKCGVKEPDCSFCEKDDLAKNITDHCNFYCKRYKECKCVDPVANTPDEFVGCIGNCVYPCQKSLDLELKLGFPLTWRQRKCPRKFFHCNPDGSEVCGKIQPCTSPFAKGCVETECSWPLGTGKLECFHDDPFCGGRKAFPEDANETDTSIPNNMCMKPKNETNGTSAEGGVVGAPAPAPAPLAFLTRAVKHWLH